MAEPPLGPEGAAAWKADDSAPYFGLVAPLVEGLVVAKGVVLPDHVDVVARDSNGWLSRSPRVVGEALPDLRLEIGFGESARSNRIPSLRTGRHYGDSPDYHRSS